MLSLSLLPHSWHTASSWPALRLLLLLLVRRLRLRLLLRLLVLRPMLVSLARRLRPLLGVEADVGVSGGVGTALPVIASSMSSCVHVLMWPLMLSGW